MPELLFIYGTLHPTRAPREIAAVARRLVSVGQATVRARYFELGEYPGIVLDDDATEIAGELFELPDDLALAALDRYEDFRPDDPDASLFLRVRTLAAMSDGSQRKCWVYVWNGEHPVAPPQQPEDEWDTKRGDCCSGE